jgi:hypothetical protein
MKKINRLGSKRVNWIASGSKGALIPAETARRRARASARTGAPPRAQAFTGIF